MVSLAEFDFELPPDRIAQSPCPAAGCGAAAVRDRLSPDAGGPAFVPRPARTCCARATSWW